MYDDSSNFLSICGLESSLIDAEEELFRAADVATLEADRSHRDVERWRLETSAQLQRLANMQREKDLLLKETSRLEKNLEQIKNASSTSGARGGHNVRGASERRALDYRAERENVYKLEGGDVVVLPGTFELAARGRVSTREVELRYLMSRTISELDAVQVGISALRKQHSDLWHQSRQIAEDISRLEATHKRQEKQKEELLRQKLFVTAAEADPAFRAALQQKQELEGFIHHAADRRLALKQLRMQRASMVNHLLDGALFRERQARNLHKKIAQNKMFSDHPMYSMMLLLQEENGSLRTKYLQLIRITEEEDAALAEYLDVLEEGLMLRLRDKK